MDSIVYGLISVVVFVVAAIYLLSRNKIRKFGIPSKTTDGGGEKGQDKV